MICVIEAVTNADRADALATCGPDRPVQVVSIDGDSAIVDYVKLKQEAHARHQDRLATLAYEPADWITTNVGPRPSEPRHRRAWDAIVDRTLSYRTEQQIPDLAPGLLGPEPPSSDTPQRIAWLTARRDIEQFGQALTAGQNIDSRAIR